MGAAPASASGPPRSWTATFTPPVDGTVDGTKCIRARLRCAPIAAEPDSPAPGPDPGREVLAVNQRFYDAFEAADLDSMSDVWEHSDRVVCTHPGWTTLRGWGAVSASWVALFGGANRLQFILTD